MKFYHFTQNNSGGRYCGPTHLVVEAKDAKTANLLAINSDHVEVYFEGCNHGQDCNCCGDRWHPVDEGKGEEFPHIYHAPLDDPANERWVEILRWTVEAEEVMVLRRPDQPETMTISSEKRECTDAEFEEYESINHHVITIRIGNKEHVHRWCRDRNFWEWVSRHRARKKSECR